MPGRIAQVLRLRITMRESVAFLDGRAGLSAADEVQDAEYGMAEAGAFRSLLDSPQDRSHFARPRLS